MTTRTTKWNYLRRARPHETIDPTRRGHKHPPLVLNPYQFSELRRLADAEGVDPRSAEDTRLLSDNAKLDAQIPRHTHESARGNLIRKRHKYNGNGGNRSSSRKINKQAESEMVKGEVQPEDSVSQRGDKESDEKTHSPVGSSNSSLKQHRQVLPKPELEDARAMTAANSPELKISRHESKEEPICEHDAEGVGNGKVRNKLKSSKDELRDSDYWSDSTRGKPVISSDSNTLEHYNFPGLEHTPEMKQLMALRAQLHAMKLQTKKQAEEQAVRCHRSYRHPETIPDNPHYDRWEPKILYEDSSNKELYRKWRKLKRENAKKQKHSQPVRPMKAEMEKEDLADNDMSMISTSSVNSPLQDTYSKAVFQRGGEFEPEKIRKRYVFSKTHWLKGDGFEAPERDKWVKKPDPEYITVKKVDPNDPRFCRRAKSASLISLVGPSEEISTCSSSIHCSLSSQKGNHSSTDLVGTLDQKSDVSVGKNHPRMDGKISEGQPKINRRSKSAAPARTDAKREELPHQKHHDFRKLKEIFSAPRPEYDRLARDRETLTQYEKEMLMLSKSQQKPDKKKIVSEVEKQLEVKKEETPEERSAALLKQVRKGRVEQLEEKASALQQRLLQEGKWDRRMLLQQRQHLQRLQQKHAQKQEAQKKMRKALTKLIAERRARERDERAAQERERIEREQQNLQHEHHERALKKQLAAEKQAKLQRLQQELQAAQQKHDKLDLHYAVARRKEYRDRKRSMQRGAPQPPLLPPSPRHFSKEAAAITQNAPVFQTVAGH